MTDRAADEAGAPAHGRGSRRLEAAEIRAWRVEKVRRWPRRVWALCLRILAVCVGVAVLLFVLGQTLTLTTTFTQGLPSVSRSSVPHQK